MPDETADETTQENTETTPETAAPAAPAPSYVPADEFKLFQSTITGTLDTIRESLQALNNSRVQSGNTAPVVQDATDEEIDTALAEGKGAKVFRKMMAAAKAELDAKYDARAREIEDTASGSLAGMALEMAKPKMKYYDKPYVKQEVDNYIKQMPANQRLNPQNHLVVYNAVVGAHMDKIVAEELEAAARKNRNTVGAQPGGSTGRSNESPVHASVKEVFGDEAERELRSRGRSLESIAKAFGMTVDEYIKAGQGEGESTVQ